MKYKLVILGLASLIVCGQALAQSQYAGEERRAIKALSESQVNGYLNARGMGFAKAAELNSYPGPLHVLELSEKLGLSQQQLAATKAIHAKMKDRATALGKKLVEKEQRLDDLFATKSIYATSLEEAVNDIGRIRSELRFVHLLAHIEQEALLSKHQVQLYNTLRGYDGNSGGHHRHGH